MYDKDHDGILSVQKLGAVLRALGHNPTEIEIQEMIDEIDSEGTYIKFVLYTINFYGWRIFIKHVWISKLVYGFYAVTFLCKENNCLKGNIG